MAFLILILAILIGVYLFLQIQRQQTHQTKQTIRYIDPSVVNEFVQHTGQSDILGNDFIILDVRLPREYRRGHIRKALNYDFLDPDFAHQIKRLDKAQQYIICAERDSRSLKAIEVLQAKGFGDLYVLTGGMLEWNMQNYPIEK